MKKVVKENLIAFSLACGIGLTFALLVNINQNGFDDTSTQASILSDGTSIQQDAGDIEAKIENGTLKIISNKQFAGVESLSFKIKYDANKVNFGGQKYSSIYSGVSISNMDDGNSYVLITKVGSIPQKEIFSINFSGNKDELTVVDFETIMVDGSKENPSLKLD